MARTAAVTLTGMEVTETPGKACALCPRQARSTGTRVAVPSPSPGPAVLHALQYRRTLVHSEENQASRGRGSILGKTPPPPPAGPEERDCRRGRTRRWTLEKGSRPARSQSPAQRGPDQPGALSLLCLPKSPPATGWRQFRQRRPRRSRPAAPRHPLICQRGSALQRADSSILPRLPGGPHESQPLSQGPWLHGT